MRKLVYVMAPFRASTEMKRQANIWQAKLIGVELAKAGFAPVVPHATVAYYYDTLPEEKMMEICLSLLQACDFAYRVALSDGVRTESTFAEQQGIQIFSDLETLCKRTSSMY